jgi:hypothetical protein
MNFNDVLNVVIDDGINAALQSYSKPYQSLKREGSIFGFNECRGLNAQKLAELLISAEKTTKDKMMKNSHDYWYWRCRHAEIEWVCNVMSAVLVSHNESPIASYSLRGMMKAVEILGVKDNASF